MGATSVAVLVVAFVLFVATSERFRLTASEFFSLYCVNLLRYAWPYLLIWAGYELTERSDLDAALLSGATAVPYLAHMIVAAVIVFMILLMASIGFHDLANELWLHYIVNLLRLGWPYVAILAVYQVLSDGSAVGFVRHLAGTPG
jgi:hypothetical protein